MKKILALLVVLALMLGVGALADEASQFVGKWVLTEMEMGGVALNPSILGYTVELTLNADGTAVGYDSETGDNHGTWSASAKGVTIVIGGPPDTLEYDGNALSIEEEGVIMRFTREGDAPDVGGNVGDDDVIGEWILTGVEVAGTTFPLSVLGIEMTMTLNADGSVYASGSLEGEDETSSGTWTRDGDAVTIALDGEPEVFIIEDSTLVAEMDGTKMIFSRADGEQPDSGDGSLNDAVLTDFIGTWSAYEIEMMGIKLPMETYGVEMTFAFDGKTVSLSSDSTGDSGETTLFYMEGSTLVLEGNTYVRLHADGTMSISASVEEIDAVFWLKRVK